ncbi:unnamed protein product [Lymnaea stagnalis]|uniref:Uncharacterized protein n=1 Tax=Lymnaea stagnalis TaxID=6523 RepID=A0AAV2IKI7_LYMST
MSSVTTEPSSTETVTSRVSSSKDYLDERSKSIISLNGSANVTQPLTGGDNVIRVYRSSPHYLPLACLALLLNPFLGIPAVVCSLLSRKYRKDGNSTSSGKCSELALWLSIIAIASALVIIVFAIVYAFVITPNIIMTIGGIPGEMDVGQATVEDMGFSHVTVAA